MYNISINRSIQVQVHIYRYTSDTKKCEEFSGQKRTKKKRKQKKTNKINKKSL